MSAFVATASSALVVRPERRELPLAGGRPLDEAEQEEQLGVGVPERMTLEVEEHVAVVGRRERGEPDRVGRVEIVDQGGVVGGRRWVEQLERRLLVGRVAGLHLEAGLANERRPAGLVEIGDLVIEDSQRSDRRHSVLLEQQAIGGADTGDVHERIGGPPLGLAHQLELAELAVVARLGPGVGLGASSARSFASWLRRRRQYGSTSATRTASTRPDPSSMYTNSGSAPVPASIASA